MDVRIQKYIKPSAAFENKQEINNKIWTYSSILHCAIKTLDIQPQFPALSYMYKLSKLGWRDSIKVISVERCDPACPALTWKSKNY